MMGMRHAFKAASHAAIVSSSKEHVRLQFPWCSEDSVFQSTLFATIAVITQIAMAADQVGDPIDLIPDALKRPDILDSACVSPGCMRLEAPPQPGTRCGRGTYQRISRKEGQEGRQRHACAPQLRSHTTTCARNTSVRSGADHDTMQPAMWTDPGAESSEFM